MQGLGLCIGAGGVFPAVGKVERFGGGITSPLGAFLGFRDTCWKMEEGGV